ncbi:hypothetical protein HanPSC8_Chr09g0363231 [Helianthus annuus]|nr:hypothetical protein HanPSC8_Chr09g0363231 [Helianthus annuus]
MPLISDHLSLCSPSFYEHNLFDIALIYVISIHDSCLCELTDVTVGFVFAL